MRKILIIASVVLLSTAILQAQTAKSDSLRALARTDVKNFHLKGANYKEFKKDKSNSNSDFFKPATETVSSPALLSDSVYVKEFRHLAYKKTLHRKTAAHYVLVSAGAIVLASFVVLLGLFAAVKK